MPKESKDGKKKPWMKNTQNIEIIYFYCFPNQNFYPLCQFLACPEEEQKIPILGLVKSTHQWEQSQPIHCDAIRSEYLLILCRLTSLLTLVVCSRMVRYTVYRLKIVVFSEIAIEYPYLDDIYFALISLDFKFIFKTPTPLNWDQPSS